MPDFVTAGDGNQLPADRFRSLWEALYLCETLAHDNVYCIMHQKKKQESLSV